MLASFTSMDCESENQSLGNPSRFRPGGNRSKDKKVRPIRRRSLLAKRFKTFYSKRRNLDLTRIHPLIVLADLKNGSLESLAGYLVQEGGIPDREVAVTLANLIAGRFDQTEYRIEFVEHRDTPKAKGGRPRTPQRKPTQAEFEIAGAFEKLAAPGRVEAAAAAVAAVAEKSVGTVYAYVARVKNYNAKVGREAAEKSRLEKHRDQCQLEFEQMLSDLREESKNSPK